MIRTAVVVLKVKFDPNKAIQRVTGQARLYEDRRLILNHTRNQQTIFPLTLVQGRQVEDQTSNPKP